MIAVGRLVNETYLDGITTGGAQGEMSLLVHCDHIVGTGLGRADTGLGWADECGLAFIVARVDRNSS